MSSPRQPWLGSGPEKSCHSLSAAPLTPTPPFQNRAVRWACTQLQSVGWDYSIPSDSIKAKGNLNIDERLGLAQVNGLPH